MTISLTKRYNKDGSISLLGYKGRVVFKSKDPRAIETFAGGWYGDRKPKWNRPQFATKIGAAR